MGRDQYVKGGLMVVILDVVKRRDWWAYLGSEAMWGVTRLRGRDNGNVDEDLDEGRGESGRCGGRITAMHGFVKQ